MRLLTRLWCYHVGIVTQDIRSTNAHITTSIIMSVDICQINQVLPNGLIMFGKNMFMYLASDYQRVHVYVNGVCSKHELLCPHSTTYNFW